MLAVLLAVMSARRLPVHRKRRRSSSLFLVNVPCEGRGPTVSS